MVVDAVNAGKDIYCEKPMSHSAADGLAMVAAAQKTGRIVQIGSQRVSSVICAKAKEMISQGMIGTLTLVEGSLGRNDPTGAWEYPPPPDLSPKTSIGIRGRARCRQAFNRRFCAVALPEGVRQDLRGTCLCILLADELHAGLNASPKKAMALGAILRFGWTRHAGRARNALRLWKRAGVSAAESGL